MKIFFYGACHATALQNILRRYGPSDVTADRIHNFELIQRQQEFPFESLGRYDAVVFSPIVGRGEWNTDRLVTACREQGVRPIAFPLIEWRGYFPGLTAAGGGREVRYYPDLFKRALEHDSFGAFETFVIEDHTIDTAPAQAARASTLLRRMEEFGDVQISVCRMIDAGYRDQRMMLTPTHPTRALYSAIVRELELILGFRVDPSFHYGTYEPQDEAKDPLLPATIRALGLHFSDCEFRSPAYFGDQRARSLRDWLQMYFFGARRAVTFEAKTSTFIKRRPQMAASLPPSDLIKVKPGDVVVALEGGRATPDSHRINVLDSNRDVEAGTDWFLYPPAWRRYDFRPAA